MREFFADLRYMCSNDNTTSKWFYRICLIVSVIILIAAVVALGFVVLGKLVKNTVLVVALSVVAIVLVVGLWVLLARQ